MSYYDKCACRNSEEKLAMVEQAVNSKEAEIKARCTELNEARSQAAAELQEAREMVEELKGMLERERQGL